MNQYAVTEIQAAQFSLIFRSLNFMNETAEVGKPTNFICADCLSPVKRRGETVFCVGCGREDHSRENLTPQRLGVMTLEEAGQLLRDFQINEWTLDRRQTKKAIKEQRAIIKRLLEGLTGREIANRELDHIIGSMN